MASLVDQIRRYLSTPQGHRNLEKAKVMARDPRNQQRLREFVARFRSRGPKR
ncbi:hypothetical protein OHA77_35080 [Streptosporangium sp. NBC_01639]|uniref:hypothetical protein n=1 Tax=unclassified Streptosporangium TaxID=2632669 RepID=UPI002DDAB570|nr:hypothetical protein [Streptosporangium sp. NBC_01756]WSC87513.1 hypothetical protein OIE48_04680 [Streptosporangium sp. NBC_01756]WTD53809.1 hypothetical protein OHA77_35080 [Streptosporangium sp. NBC_01639]